MWYFEVAPAVHLYPGEHKFSEISAAYDPGVSTKRPPVTSAQSLRSSQSVDESQDVVSLGLALSLIVPIGQGIAYHLSAGQ